MKIIHTFWMDKVKDTLKDNFGWCSAHINLMGWEKNHLQLLLFYVYIEKICLYIKRTQK
ncbi:DUF6734 family protein [Arthrospiribacter ruber]|uniref:DUF6734 family protein n=1 Tax=Arthrospiribacter ruber TaxID=2487934 RepID=UPI003CCED54D